MVLHIKSWRIQFIPVNQFVEMVYVNELIQKLESLNYDSEFMYLFHSKL